MVAIVPITTIEKLNRIIPLFFSSLKKGKYFKSMVGVPRTANSAAINEKLNKILVKPKISSPRISLNSTRTFSAPRKTPRNKKIEDQKLWRMTIPIKLVRRGR